jgi:hypothetical protein
MVNIILIPTFYDARLDVLKRKGNYDPARDLIIFDMITTIITTILSLNEGIAALEKR